MNAQISKTLKFFDGSTGLQIPQKQHPVLEYRKTSASKTQSRQWFKHFCDWLKNVKAYFSESKRKDQLRWALQVGVTGGIIFSIIALIFPMSDFFGRAGLLGFVIVPICNEATAGASLRRNLLYILLVPCLSSLAYGLFVVSTGGGENHNTGYGGIGLSFSAVLLIIPVCVLRYYYPTITVGLSLGLSIAENVLLGNASAFSSGGSITYIVKRILAVVITAIVSIIVTHSVCVKAARPTASTSLAIILDAMACVVDPLASSLHPKKLTEKDMFGSSSALLLASYPHLLASTHQFLQGLTGTVLQDDSVILESCSKMQEAQERSKQSHRIIVQQILEPKKKTCELMMQNMNKCQQLLNSQKDLVLAASQEVSCREPRIFPKKKYMAVLNEVRTLFFHISCLAYVINLYLSTVENRLQKDLISNSNNLQQTQDEISQFKIPHAKSAPATRLHMKSDHPKLAGTTHLGHAKEIESQSGDLLFQYTPLLAPFAPFKQTFASQYDLRDLSNILGLGGYNFNKIAQHIVTALKLLSECLNNRMKTSVVARQEIEEIATTLKHMNESRRQQRDKFGEIVVTTLEADVTGHWRRNSPLDWRGALFLTADQLRNMSMEEKLVYWEAYWLGRDRVSTTEQTLQTLHDSLARLCYHIDNYVDVALSTDATVIAMIP